MDEEFDISKLLDRILELVTFYAKETGQYKIIKDVINEIIDSNYFLYISKESLKNAGD